jgi:hypothetical protein
VHPGQLDTCLFGEAPSVSRLSEATIDLEMLC